MMVFAQFMSTFTGRVIRFAFGSALMAVGFIFMDGSFSMTLAAIGIVPIMGALFNVCLFAHLIHLGPHKASC